MSELHDIAEQVRRQLAAERRLPKVHLSPVSPGAASRNVRWWIIRLESEQIGRSVIIQDLREPAWVFHDKVRRAVREKLDTDRRARELRLPSYRTWIL